MKSEYNLIVPSLERTGPVNVAVDIGKAASKAGWKVRIIYLSGSCARDDLDFAAEVSRFCISDFWTLRGVVHTHCLRPDLLGFVFCLNKKIKLVTTIHIFFFDDLAFIHNSIYIRFAWELWKRALQRFHLVVCISNAMREYYIQLLPDQLFQVVYNFRSLPRLPDENAEAVKWITKRKASSNIVLSFVGVLSERKNIYELIEVLPNNKNISLVICGDGPLLETINELVELYNLNDRVRFEGLVSSPAGIVRLTDGLILPSHAEGFPLVVIEAASVGVGSLLSDIPVHRELVKIGFGYTFDHNEFSDLEKVAETLCQSYPVPSNELIELWATKFTPDAGFKSYENLIHTL